MKKESFIENEDTQKVCSHHMTFAKEVYSAIDKKADGRTFFWAIGGAYTGIAIIITVLLTLMSSRNSQYTELQKQLTCIDRNLAILTEKVLYIEKAKSAKVERNVKIDKTLDKINNLIAKNQKKVRLKNGTRINN